VKPPPLVDVDAVVLRVPDLEAGLAFYRDSLGHEVVWRTDRMAGLRLARSETELVLSLDLGPETDLLVDSVDDAVRRFVEAGGTIVAEPADIPVGRVAVVRDPFGNALTLVDLTKGRYPRPAAEAASD
jgi:predicted enzyme related to lactoylglutathione lyase